MNSGLVDATRYNDTIFDSLAAIKVQAGAEPDSRSLGLLGCLTLIALCWHIRQLVPL